MSRSPYDLSGRNCAAEYNALPNQEAEEWRQVSREWRHRAEAAEAKLRAIRALADGSRDARHGPGGCGIYARELYAVINGEKEGA